MVKIFLALKDVEKTFVAASRIFWAISFERLDNFLLFYSKP